MYIINQTYTRVIYSNIFRYQMNACKSRLTILMWKKFCPIGSESGDFLSDKASVQRVHRSWLRLRRTGYLWEIFRGLRAIIFIRLSSHNRSGLLWRFTYVFYYAYKNHMNKTW